MEDELFRDVRRLREEMARDPRGLDKSIWAAKLVERGITIPPERLPGILSLLLGEKGEAIGQRYVPPVLLDIIPRLLAGHRVDLICDPWAGVGVLAACVQKSIHARSALAFAAESEDAVLGRVIAPKLDWRVGDPLSLASTTTQFFDAVVSILPMGGGSRQAVEMKDLSGSSIRLEGDLGHLVLAAASARLAEDGLGLFVVTPRFFFSPKSILRALPGLGLGVDAALALPAGSFAPHAGVSTYLLVVKRQIPRPMFVAQLTRDQETNELVLANYHERRTEGEPQLGRLISSEEFRGIESYQYANDLRKLEERFGGAAIPLANLAESIRLGRYSDGGAFPEARNALYIPLLGHSDVVDSPDGLTLKVQNYAQVTVNPLRSDARFIARFLNTELGRSSREICKGGIIPRLNTAGIGAIRVIVPALERQRQILDLEAQVESERNTLLGLQNDLDSLRRELWSGHADVDPLRERLRTFSERFPTETKSTVESSFEEWFETLPFPLASILHAWRTTSPNDYRAKSEHLLHFLEATAEFLSVIFLSAFASSPRVLALHLGGLNAAWVGGKVRLDTATFGTWKVVIEYLGARTREFLSKNDMAQLCSEMFADRTLSMARMLARTDLASLIAEGNKMRNRRYHGGVVGEEAARLRSEALLSVVQEMRMVMGNTWQEFELVGCHHVKPRRNGFDNMVSVLTGSHSEFLRETRSMSFWLDVESLYLVSRQSGQALRLLPLLKVGQPPKSQMNACYFFSRIQKEQVEFISYHFVDQPEWSDRFQETADAVSLLTQDTVPDRA